MHAYIHMCVRGCVLAWAGASNSSYKKNFSLHIIPIFVTSPQRSWNPLPIIPHQ